MANAVDPALLAAFTAAIGLNPRPVIVPPQAPIMGGLLPPDSKGISIAYTGGEPLPDWSGLAGTAPHPVGSPNCNRPIDVSDSTKNWNLRISKPDYLLKKNDPNFGIVQIAAQVQEHAVEYGMDSIMYVPSRADPTGPAVNLITSFEQVTIDHVITESTNYRNNLWDEYDIKNDQAMKIYLRGCMDTSLKSVLSLYIMPYDTAAVIWMRIVKSIHDTSVNRYRQLKLDLAKLTPLNEPGQNIREYTVKVRKIFEELTSARQFTWDLMVPVLRALEQVSVAKFTGFIPMLEERVNQGITDTAYFTTEDADAEMRLRSAHWVNILELMETRYDGLISAKTWDPANFLTEKSSSEVNALIQNTAAKPACNYCGSTDHWSNKCPDKPNLPLSGKSTNSSNTSVITTSTVSWKNVPPASGSPEVKVKNDRTFYWCSKCFRGVGRWNASHKTSEHKSNLPQQPTAAIADVPVSSISVETSTSSINLAAADSETMKFVFM